MIASSVSVALMATGDGQVLPVEFSLDVHDDIGPVTFSSSLSIPDEIGILLRIQAAGKEEDNTSRLVLRIETHGMAGKGAEAADTVVHILDTVVRALSAENMRQAIRLAATE